MPRLININEFLELKSGIPLVDVRSPAEFRQGHINGAINIPLFNNEERAIVGTLYKKSGQKDAVLAGLEIAGRKMRQLAESGLKAAKNKQLILHCWRGGMRSSSMSWLLETCGIKCFVIEGGYKSFRRFVPEFFSRPYNFIVIGGMTGSGKTEILYELAKSDHQVLMLEELAHHKGSAFGSLGEPGQNTNEQFENDIFASLCSFDISRPVFVEDESRNIGRNTIPGGIYENIIASPVAFIEMDKKLRVEKLVEEYGKFPNEDLKTCIRNISKRLGGQNTKLALELLDEGKTREVAEISLSYYDKAYSYSLTRKIKNANLSIPLKSTDSKINAKKILETLRRNKMIR
jgi:tRNA 2-selenouridine synthase